MYSASCAHMLYLCVDADLCRANLFRSNDVEPDQSTRLQASRRSQSGQKAMRRSSKESRRISPSTKTGESHPKKFSPLLMKAGFDDLLLPRISSTLFWEQKVTQHEVNIFSFVKERACLAKVCKSQFLPKTSQHSWGIICLHSRLSLVKS